MHDTLKKPRDLLMVSYGVRYPELAAKVKHGGGEVEMDPAVRLRLPTRMPLFPDLVLTDRRRGPSETVSRRTVGDGDHLFQLSRPLAFFVCHQSCTRTERHDIIFIFFTVCSHGVPDLN